MHRIPLLAILLAAHACDLPFQLPEWETEWELVAAADTIGVRTVLPPEVRLAEGPEGGFRIESILSSETFLLEEACEFCTCLSGPVPRITIPPMDWRLPLPSRIREVSLDEGSARITLLNRIGFDLLSRPAGTEPGEITITLLDLRTGTEVRHARIDPPFPEGARVEVLFDLAGLLVHPQLVARVRGRIPGTECAVELTPEMGIEVEVELREISAPWVRVILAGSDLNPPARSFDLPAALLDRLRRSPGRVLLEIEVTSTLPLEIDGLLSVGTAATLFSEKALLHTPLPLPAGRPGAPTLVRDRFYLDMARLQEGDRISFATANRPVGGNELLLFGEEAISWRVTLHSEIPLR